MIMYKWLKPLNGDAVIGDVHFGRDGIVIVRNRIEKLDFFVKEGWMSCEPYDPKATRLEPPSTGPEGSQTVPQQPATLPNPDELDPVTRAVMELY